YFVIIMELPAALRAVGQVVAPANKRRLKAGGSQDWLPHWLLPVGVRAAVEARLVGSAVHFPDAGLGLVHALGGVLHLDLPVGGIRHGIDGDGAQVTFAYQVRQALGALAFVVAAIVDDRAEGEQVVVQNALFGADDGAVVDGDGHRDEDDDDRDHHHHLDECEAPAIAGGCLTARRHSRDGHRSLTVAARMRATTLNRAFHRVPSPRSW